VKRLGAAGVNAGGRGATGLALRPSGRI